MVSQASLSLGNRNPDVLTCIANLSNDEVFTPPEIAGQMLDLLAQIWAEEHGGENLWTNPDVRFLDPFTKSGIFLREITSRLVHGLAVQVPNLEDRVDHILTKQVYGIGITHLTALLARRTIYCSKFADGAHSVAKSFDTPAGNIWFEPMQHSWVGGTEWVITTDRDGETVNRPVDGRCSFCGATQKTLDRGEGLESHAYAFIHTDDIHARVREMFGEPMQFDVVIGNPPYQLGTDGHGNQARPIYQLFVEQAKRLEPKYLVMVTPSRWFSGGMGLSDFREAMLRDRRMRKLIDFPKLYEGFTGVKIRGGVSYFLWSREYDGPCEVQTIWDGEPTGPAVPRYLDQFDILVRRNEAVPILEKVQAKREPTLDQRVSSQKPFGLATNFKGNPSPKGMKSPIRLYANQKIEYVERANIPVNADWVDQWKVLMTRIQGTSAAVETKFLSKPIIAEPGTACTETYLVAGHFDAKETAEVLASYLRTRFVRFLVSLRKPTQDALRPVYGFVPDLPLDQLWTDAKLYKRYGLTRDEIAFVESQVAAHDDDGRKKSDE